MPSAQRVPPSEEVPWLRARVAELEAVQARLAVLAEQIEELHRRLGKDSVDVVEAAVLR